MAFAPRRRARRLVAYLRSERRTLRQGFAALLLSTAAGLVAGVTLGSISHTLVLLPSLYILIHAAVGMKGTIFGAIGARFGTATNLGTFEVSRRRTGVLYQNVYVGFVTTFSSALYLAALARLSAVAFGLPSISFLDFVTIAVVGGVLGSAIAMVITVGLSVISYRRAYDLDAVSTPIVTAAGDMVTIPCLYLATFLVRVEWLDVAVAVACMLACAVVTFQGYRTKLPLARRAILEMTAVILLTPLLDILAGTVIEPRIVRFAAFPALLAVIPPLVSNAGALGGILSSRLSSKLHLGVIGPGLRPELPAVLDGALVAVFGVVAFLAVGLAGFAYGELIGKSAGALVTIGGTLLTGLLATVVAIAVAYYVAVITTRFGLDPDNHGVPIITSVMDLSGVLCFLLVLSMLGAPTHV
jgi:mgtE-like transporter